MQEICEYRQKYIVNPFFIHMREEIWTDSTTFKTA